MSGPADLLETVLGLSAEPHTLTVAQIAVRAAVAYIVLIALIRLGKKRFLGEATAFDVILVIVIGSTASRAITGSAPFVAALAAVALLIAMHWVFSALGRSSPRIARLIKGQPTILVKGGRVDRCALREEHMSSDDLDEDLRHHGLSGPSGVAEARLERDGRLSVLKRG